MHWQQLELGPIRTLLYGAIAGCCSEAATYPFEVVRRQLQMQVRATRLNPLETCVKIVEQGGVPALYAGLIPSLLQVLPSAAISYLVYEFMKIVLKVESNIDDYLTNSNATYYLILEDENFLLSPFLCHPSFFGHWYDILYGLLNNLNLKREKGGAGAEKIFDAWLIVFRFSD
ncbi:Mitochondrial substrate/solute carrier [Sesbania bispinosa]|nr:Mitochondrial substrate/solute carrier [Sesbania bispinosa]